MVKNKAERTKTTTSNHVFSLSDEPSNRGPGAKGEEFAQEAESLRKWGGAEEKINSIAEIQNGFNLY